MDRSERRTRGGGQRDLASSPLRAGGLENTGVASPPVAPRPSARGGDVAASAASAVLPDEILCSQQV